MIIIFMQMQNHRLVPELFKKNFQKERGGGGGGRGGGVGG